MVSPHLDDAALSVGATIAERSLLGQLTDVVTVFSGPGEPPLSPVARRFHGECGLDEDAVAVRMREDASAMAILGAAQHHLGFPDAIYRRRADGGWLCEDRYDMFRPGGAGEPGLTGEITAALADRCRRTRPGLLVTCRGIGGHIDHLMTRDAALAVAVLEELPILLWEDLPYALRQPESGELDDPRDFAPSALAWSRKWRAIRSYASQIPMLWPGGQNWLEMLLRHACVRGARYPTEQLWAVDPGLVQRHF